MIREIEHDIAKIEQAIMVLMDDICTDRRGWHRMIHDSSNHNKQVKILKKLQQRAYYEMLNDIDALNRRLVRMNAELKPENFVSVTQHFVPFKTTNEIIDTMRDWEINSALAEEIRI